MTKKKILIVDDDEILAKLLKTVLERSEHYEAQYVTEALKALAAIKGFGPDLVILDVEMPDARGEDILKIIESDPVFGKTPVIFLTGTVSSEQSRMGLMIVDRPAMCKPIHMEELIACIEKNIRR